MNRPVRDRAQHAAALERNLDEASEAANARGLERDDPLPLTYELQPHALDVVKSLERPSSSIQLLNAVERPASILTTVLVPANKLALLRGILRRYATELDPRSGRPKHQNLIENIDSIRLATERELWTDSIPFPEPDAHIWWEVWLHHAANRDPAETLRDFQTAAQSTGLRVKRRHVTFPERVVVLAFGSYTDWDAAPRLLLHVAELRKAKELPTDYVEAAPRFQGEIARDFMKRVEQPPARAPAVCLLDTGVGVGHPLLYPAMASRDAQAINRDWGSADQHPARHGTQMAGIALYGSDLAELLRSDGALQLTHRLESVKILHHEQQNEPDAYGSITQQAVGLMESLAPERDRVVCLTATADARDGGLPSSWSAAVDQLCFGGEIFGVTKLLCAAAGNLREQISSSNFRYFDTADPAAGVEDPAQSWNALTVGAATERVMIGSQKDSDLSPIAPLGDLSPTSRTSLAWPEGARRGWPIKPDIVMEGGNWAATASGGAVDPDDLGLLTTTLGGAGELFTVTRDTSPATAAAARLAAQVWSQYPELWPETVRALLVHSARWTDAMCERFPASSKAAIQDRLRCYGYGQPNLERAAFSSETAATLWFQGMLTPYHRDGATIKAKEMHVHELPWPVEVLQKLGHETLRIRITLSHFIEPSPGRRGWTVRHRYASHGLRFDLQRKTESREAFLMRVSNAFEEDEVVVDEPTSDALPWLIGERGRTQGSIHSDVWEGTAAELANCSSLVVYPVTGWWRERKHLGRWASQARYSLVVSLESERSDIYTPIAARVGVPVEIRS